MFMLSRQVTAIVDVVFVIQSLGKVKSQKHNLTVLTTREAMKMHKNIHLQYFCCHNFNKVFDLKIY